MGPEGLFPDADQIILLHRELLAASTDAEAVDAAQAPAGAPYPGDGDADGAADNLSPMTLVRVGKARHRPTRDALLYFEGAQHRFREVTEVDRQRVKPRREDGGRRERQRKDLE